ncbi:hypothetical protein ACERIT_06805 [Halopenitus sp. H-Gu1]|uniref:hypothetical protein n=1 Tax=Halopenitus sp. H-Gu1 TaxID=3242697 RepID=UPI00359E1D0E
MSGECADTDGLSVDPMLAVYRHDLHKARWRSHTNAAETFAGVRVNESVPFGADRDSALLSRPDGEPEQTVANHASPLRISLLTGETKVSVGHVEGPVHPAMVELMQIEEPVAMHEAWLSSSVVSLFNEAVYYPYTSLKFHTLLAAALLDNYRVGYAFDELYLVVDPPTGVTVTDQSPAQAEAESSVHPHRTILSTAEFALRITGEPGERPAARLGPRPARSFADVWSRLPEQPVDTDAARVWRVLDAQLRRIRSWSVALQYIEEFVPWARAMPFADYGPVTDAGGDGL